MWDNGTSLFDLFDWSMFTQDWSFETANSTRGDIESIGPKTRPLDPSQALQAQISATEEEEEDEEDEEEQILDPNQALQAQIFATEEEQIPSHPAIKFLDRTLTVELDSQPDIGPQPTESTTLQQILPQYATLTKFVTFLIYDFTPVDVMNAQKEQAELIESTKIIFSQLSKFPKISHFHVKLITDQPETCQTEMMSVLLGLSLKNMALTIVWPFSNHQLDLLIV